MDDPPKAKKKRDFGVLWISNKAMHFFRIISYIFRFTTRLGRFSSTVVTKMDVDFIVPFEMIGLI